jgi:O-antigen/teichoic acid export membrane protein
MEKHNRAGCQTSFADADCGASRLASRRAVAITTFANLVISLVGICTGVASARLLGPKGRGELAAIQSWPTVLSSLGLLGTAEALVYFCALERSRRASYLSACLMIGACGACVSSIAGFFAMPWLLRAQTASTI